MNNFIRISGMILSSIFVIVLSSIPVGASKLEDGANAARGEGMPDTLFGNSGIITDITNVMLFLAGALAVVMIIYGGLRYVISGGNSTAVSAAKNTILYAIVGLVVAFLAFAVVNFVLEALSPTSTDSDWIDA